jgi:ketosteroid isomerase-like protein
MHTEALDQAEETLAAVDRFNEAFNNHDVDAIMRLMTEDCVFESTSPAPDGWRVEGQDAVRAVWEDLFRSSPDARFEAEEIFASKDRCVARWVYTFGGGHIRGVDVMRVRDGKLAEKLSYVKG